MANKVSEITTAEVAEYIRLDEASSSELQQIGTFLVVAKSYIKASTGLTNAEVDSYPDIVIAVFVLCQDMYDNRTFYIDDKSGVNKVVDAILGMHRRNFLPSGGTFTADVFETATETPYAIQPVNNALIAFGSIVTAINGSTPVTDTPIEIDHAEVVLNADGTITVTPENEYTGSLAFEYVATAPDKKTVTVSVSITVSASDE